MLCTAPVAVDHCLYDGLVLGERDVGLPRHDREPVPVLHGTVPECYYEVGGDPVPSDLREASMKKGVQFRVSRLVVSIDGGSHRLDDRPELLPIFMRCPLRGSARQQSFERDPRLGDLYGLPDRDPAYNRAPVRRSLDEFLTGELDER